MIAAVVLTLGGITLLILGLVERTGAYDVADYQKGRLDKALAAWENAQGTSSESEAKEETDRWTSTHARTFQVAVSREGRGNLWFGIGLVLLLSNIGVFFLARKMKAKAGGEEAAS